MNPLYNMIRDLWKAWREIREKRRKAKESLRVVENLLKKIKRERDKAEECYNLLREIYPSLPKTDRQDYVQKTLDLLYFDGSTRIGAHQFYKKLYEDYSHGYTICLAKRYWEDGEYDKVIETCSILLGRINGSAEIWTNK